MQIDHLRPQAASLILNLRKAPVLDSGERILTFTQIEEARAAIGQRINAREEGEKQPLRLGEILPTYAAHVVEVFALANLAAAVEAAADGDETLLTDSLIVQADQDEPVQISAAVLRRFRETVEKSVAEFADPELAAGYLRDALPKFDEIVVQTIGNLTYDGLGYDAIQLAEDPESIDPNELLDRIQAEVAEMAGKGSGIRAQLKASVERQPLRDDDARAYGELRNAEKTLLINWELTLAGSLDGVPADEIIEAVGQLETWRDEDAAAERSAPGKDSGIERHPTD